MSKKEADEIRVALARYRGKSDSRYPDKLRKRAGRWVLAARRRNVEPEVMVEALGTRLSLLSRWATKAEKSSKPPTKVLPVAVREAKGMQVDVGALVPTLISPSGYRVEGLSLAQVAELLGVLS